jgi:hypothetical protein
LRQVLHGALLAIAAIAFLPFVLIAAGLLIALIGGFVVAASAVLGEGIEGGSVFEAGGSLIEGGGGLVRPYYRFLARLRQPLILGGAGGVVLGVLLLWAVLAVMVIPGEARTVEVLAAARAQIEQIYDEQGSYPPPDSAGHLSQHTSRTAAWDK